MSDSNKDDKRSDSGCRKKTGRRLSQEDVAGNRRANQDRRDGTDRRDKKD